MATVDLYHALDMATTLAPATRNASANGTGVDLSGYNGVFIVAQVGTITDGTHTLVVQESDDNATFTNVAAGDLLGTLAALATNVNQKVGYRGTKRYVRVNTTVSGATTGGAYGVTVIRGNARKQPV